MSLAGEDAERRWGERVPFAAHVLVARQDRAWLAQIQDLSEGGCGIFRPPGFDLAVAEVVTLYFQSAPGPAHVAGARVARVENGSIGFEYHEPQSVPPGDQPAVDPEIAPWL
ncbi:MAG: PilZ domain-containing protein [Lysobacteraceae bacterium]